MDRYSIEGSTLTGIADAIREKTGSNEDIKVEDMAEKIGEISGGGGEEVEFVTLTFNSSFTQHQGMAFCYYDESSKNWELALGTGSYSINTNKISYKLRKNSCFIVSNILWNFSPSDSVLALDGPCVYQIFADTTATFD